MTKASVKTIVITGASGGLGHSLVKEFSSRLHRLVLIARNETKLQQLVEIYAPKCHSIHYIISDLSVPNQREQLIKELSEETIDVFIHNAGYGLFETAEQFQYQQVENMMQVNVLAPIHLTNALLPKFYERGQGHVIFIASQASKMTTPKSSIYSATKYSLRGYANGIRLEAKQYGVYVTTVNPGPIATDFFKIADKTGHYVKAVGKLMLFPEDVARKIYRTTKSPKREINTPKLMAFAAILYTLFPKLSDRLTLSLFNRK